MLKVAETEMRQMGLADRDIRTLARLTTLEGDVAAVSADQTKT